MSGSSGPPLRAGPPEPEGAGRDLALAVVLPALGVALVVAIVGALVFDSAVVTGGLALLAGGLFALLRLPWYARRRASAGRLEAHRLRHPWRGWVEEAQRAKQRFDAAVGGAPRGPLSERLRDIGARVDDAVRESWRIAQRGQELEDGLGQLPLPALLQRDLAAAEAAGDAQLAAGLSTQLQTRQRLETSAGEARTRLQHLDARLDEAVARAVELSLQAGDPVELGGVGEEVDGLVTDLEALRRGLEEVRGLPQREAPGHPATGGAP